MTGRVLYLERNPIRSDRRFLPRPGESRDHLSAARGSGWWAPACAGEKE